MLFNKNLSINKLLVLGIAVCTVCASSNAMDNYGSSHSNNRTVNNYNNFSNSLNRSNIHAVGNKYKVSNPNYTIVRRDEHDIKVPTYSINRVSNRDRFTIRAQKDNTHEIFINTRDTNKKVNDIHNYLFKNGGSKKIDGTYDNSKKLIKGQYDLKNEVNKNNNDIKEFNKTMHNNLVNLENHISKLIRNNQNNHNELNKNINNILLETTKNIYNNRAQQMEDNNKLQKIMYDNNNKQQKDIHEVANILTEKTLEINKNIHYSSEKQQKDSSAILARTNEQTQDIIGNIYNVTEKNAETMMKLQRDAINQLSKAYNKDYNRAIEKYTELFVKNLDRQKETNDVIFNNTKDAQYMEVALQDIKNLREEVHAVTEHYAELNSKTKFTGFVLENLKKEEEQEKLKAMQQQNNLRQQQVLNYSNNNVINPNLQYYNPNIGSNNNYIHNYNNDNMINQNVGGDNNHIRNYNNNMFNYNNNMINLNNNLNINNYNNPINNNPNNINISSNRNLGNSFSVRNGIEISQNHGKYLQHESVYDVANRQKTAENNQNGRNLLISNNNITNENEINNDINKDPINEAEDEKRDNHNNSSTSLIQNTYRNDNNNDYLGATQILSNMESYEKEINKNEKNKNENLDFPTYENMRVQKTESGYSLPYANHEPLDLSPNVDIPISNKPNSNVNLNNQSKENNKNSNIIINNQSNVIIND